MRLWHWTVGLVIFSLVLSVSAQVSQQKKMKPRTGSDAVDQFEKAHQGLFTPKTDEAVEASRLTAEFAGSGAPMAGSVPRKNYIDEHIFGRMERDKIPHAGLASDEEFIRRVYIDATGLVPTADAVREFVASTDPNKRDKLIDALIGSEDFADQWAWYWMDLLQSKDASFAYLFKEWLRLDRPYNEMFAELVGGPAVKSHLMVPTWMAYEQPLYNASRSSTATDADNYDSMNRLDFVDEATINLGRIFLGINMDCFSCHDGAGHTDSLNLFLTSKKRAEFHQQAAFFGNVRTVARWNESSTNINTGNMIFDDLGPGYTTGNDAPFHTDAESRKPRDGRTYEPAFILTGEKPQPGMNPRQELGRILPNHIQFNRAAVNLIWGKLMVVGFVEPYSGFDLERLDPNNPPPKPWTVQPTDPWLLEAMAQDFKGHNYSIQHLIKTIMKSSAYQLSTGFSGEWKDKYAAYYARKFVRVLTGPEVADVLAQVTGQPYEFLVMGERVTRVKQVANPSALDLRPASGGAGGNRPTGGSDGSAVRALTQAFFQSTRETPPQMTNSASVIQALMMMISPAVTNRLVGEGNWLKLLLESQKSDALVVEELFLTTLSRFPSSTETEVALRILEKDRRVGAGDIQWALLNTAEFLLNH